jgi:4-amino-4-deoxy-L-arabinose transferase-like glycosyltransferase
MKRYLIEIKNKFDQKYIALFLTLYFIFNIIFLTKYPFMHSDESWLSGLSRLYIEKGTPIVTESFFDLLPRFPHSIKIFFHYIQGLFMMVFGYNLFAFRLISLLFSIGSLYFIYKISLRIFNSSKLSFLVTVLLAFDIHFIYTSHFARQEAVILFFMIFVFFYYIKYEDSLKKSIVLGIITGLNIGIHPNSLFIAAVLGSMYIYDIVFGKKSTLKSMLVYVIVTGSFAAIFVGLNLYFDPNFFQNYKEFGDQFNVFAKPTDRIGEIKNFYLKLFYQVSGTYYIPNIKLQLLLFSIIYIISFVRFLIKKNTDKFRFLGMLIFIIGAINITYIVIGRYNQTSIIFLFPFFWILFAENIRSFKYKNILILFLSLVLLIISIFSIIPYLNNDYKNYLENIGDYIDDESTVLANLNTEYYFHNNTLYDYRNLHFLKENDMSFSEYIQKNNIEYIIYPEEMDFMYNSRPVWNFIYGNLYYYYEDMESYIKENCQLIHQFDSPYAMRLSMYMYEDVWNVKIYKVTN